MKILFCTQCDPVREYGGGKAALEIAEVLRGLGWECEVRGIPDIHRSRSRARETYPALRKSFRAFMRENAGRYDVVDYDHSYLPYPRAEFAPATLLVARSVLLLEHHRHVHFRVRHTLRSWLGKLIHRRQENSGLEAARATLAQADLVNVPNDDDRIRLLEIGLSPGKIVVVPYGIWWDRWPAPVKEVGPPTLVFVGSFDYRKGCLDLVDLTQAVFAEMPTCRLRLLGTLGMAQTEAKVRAFFPRECQDRLEVVPTFAADQLPGLLRGTTLGIFPSYLEGFGMAVVEMVAGGVPVLAYRVPGPSSILPPLCLITAGNVAELTRYALQLLRNTEERERLARECTLLCRGFDWPVIGRQTADLYLRALKKLRAQD